MRKNLVAYHHGRLEGSIMALREFVREADSGTENQGLKNLEMALSLVLEYSSRPTKEDTRALQAARNVEKLLDKDVLFGLISECERLRFALPAVVSCLAQVKALRDAFKMHREK